MSKKKIIILSIIVVLIISGIFIVPKISHYIEWKQVEAAIGPECPFQIGLKNTIPDICMVKQVGTVPQCWGTKQQAKAVLCMTLTKEIGKCPLYEEVDGKMSGGDGNMALFQIVAAQKAGIKEGGDLIGCGQSMVLMDNGVLGGPGGCFGCGSKVDFIGDKAKEWANKFFIAGFKE